MNKRQILENFLTENADNAYRFAFTYTKNLQDAEDVVNESVIKALRSVGTLKNTQYIKSWFYKIIVNTSLTHLKASKKLNLVNYEDAAANSFSEDDYSNLSLSSLTEKLDVKYKSVIVLRFLENMTINEISRILDLNENTVKTRLYKALAIIKINMEDDDV